MSFPQLSIVIPAYNEAARIPATLEAVVDCVRARGWNAEILVVDDGSRDAPAAVVTAFAARNPEVRLLQNPGIIRSRAKIEATIHGAQLYLAMEKSGETFSDFAWSLAGGKPIRNRPRSMKDVPAKTALSEQISATLKKRGFKFVGPTIVYAWMQAVGIVDDHLAGCFRCDK